MELLDCDGREAHDVVPVGYLYARDKRSNSDWQVYDIWEREILKIGRDPRSNTFSTDIDVDAVSRNHCEIYVVVYEPSVSHVYVRDRMSLNGTYVNNKLIGVGPSISPGYLLQDGDVIEIRPHWQFLYRQIQSPPTHELTNLQTEETKLFKDRYTLTQRCLGHGAEGLVFLAVEPTSRRQLVCKVVNLDKTHGQNASEMRRRKLQEADVLRQLQHPNILAYIDAIISPHTLFTFTELASGGDLMSFLYRHDWIKEIDAQIIIRQVIQGLCYLHDKGIIHRDLKPENILLLYSPRIAYHRVVLSDFGTCAVPRRSRLITNVGTTNYQAPEVFSRLGVQTFAVDIWSLGIVSLLLLTSEAENHEDELNRMSQDTLDEALTGLFQAITVKRSPSSRKFIRDCLQVAPIARLTAPNAASHQWLSASAKHFEVFKKIDHVSLASWDEARLITPMPLTIPSILNDQIGPKPSSISVPTTDQDFQGEILTSELPQQFHGYTNAAKHGHNGDNDTNEPTESFMKPTTIKTAHSSAKLKRLPWIGFTPQTSVQSDIFSRTRIMSKVEIVDAMFLPFTGLDRHLKPPVNKNQRQFILDKLEESDAKFLVDSIPSS